MIRQALCALLVLAATPLEVYAVPRPSLSGARLRMLQQGENAIEIWEPAVAHEIADKLLQKDEKDPAARRLKALASFYSGDYKRAMRDARRAAREGHIDASYLNVIEATYQISKDWVTEESEHFIISTREGRDQVLVPYALEVLEKARTELYKDLGWQSPEGEKIRVEVYGSSRQFARVSTLTRKEIATTGTIALCKFNRLMITSPYASVHGYPWLDTLVHEYTHLIIVKASNNTVPIWLHEGIAKYSETRWRAAAGTGLDVSTRSVLAEAQQKDHFIDFDRMHPSIAKLPTAWEAHLAFAEVTSAVGFIKTRGGGDAVSEVLRRMKGGADVKAAIATVTGLPWRQFDAEWKVYLGEQNFQYRPELTVLPMALKDNEGSDNADAKEQYHGLKDRARQYMRLGDLLKNENRMSAAVMEYKKALRAQGTHAPMIGHKIGLTQLRSGQLKAAKASLEKVLELYPNYAPALTDLADVLGRRKEMAKAREYAWRAVTVNPYDPRPHRILVEACGKLGDNKCVSTHKASLDTLKTAHTKRARPR